MSAIAVTVPRTVPWWLLLFAPLLMALGIPVLLEIYDPVIGPQLWRESKAYVLEVHGAFLASLVLPLLGARSHGAPPAVRQ